MNLRSESERSKRAAIGILGMHRSGTSSVARVVNLLGAYLGANKDLMPPGPDNPAGYWEHNDVVPFHERLLAALRRKWDTTLPLPPDWQVSEDIAPFRDELIGLIETLFAGQPLWAWKDPRTSILLPLWRDVLAEGGVELRCLLVYRNPLDVARSLETRDGFSVNESFGLWLNHNLAMLQNSAGVPRVIVSYKDFVSDPAASVAQWAPQLSLGWSDRDRALQDSIRQSVRTDLCHSQSTLQDLVRRHCPAPVYELAAILEEIAHAGGVVSAEFESEIRRLLELHVSFSGLYVHDFSRADFENKRLEARRNQLEEWFAKAKVRERKKDKMIAKGQNLLAAALAKIKEHEARLEDEEMSLDGED